MATKNDEVLDVVDDANIIQLTTPLADGTNTLTLDFGKINGRVLLNLSKQARKEDPGCTIVTLSQAYQAMIGAKAAGLRYDDILDLAAPDFTTLCLRVQAFLVP